MLSEERGGENKGRKEEEAMGMRRRCRREKERS